MLRDPFALLTGCPVSIAFLDRSDAVTNDRDMTRVLGHDRFVTLRQMHGAAIVEPTTPSYREHMADAAITRTPDLSLVIRFADCQGMVIAHPSRVVAAVIHAGWRGLVAEVIPRTIERLSSAWNLPPAELRIGIGPSLCYACAAFTDPLREAPTLAAFIRGQCIDLRAAADAQLASCGVLPAHVERHPRCTRCEPERFFTYRGGDREAVQAGATNALTITCHAHERA